MCSFVCLLCLCLITRSCMSIGLLPLDHCLMCLALTNAFISDLILGRPRRTLYYLAMVLGMVLDWFSSPALFPPSISSSCWVCVFKLPCVLGRTHSLKRVCFSTVRAHSLDLIRFSISITRVYRHELCIETNRFTCTLLRLRCCVPCPAAAAAGIQMRVSSLCPCPGCCAGLMPSPLPWTPRPLPQRIPRRSPLGPASIGIGRRPAGQPRRRPGPVPWPGCTCAWRPVLLGSALGSTRAGGQADGGMQGSHPEQQHRPQGPPRASNRTAAGTGTSPCPCLGIFSS